jgi:hypothetical protein
MGSKKIWEARSRGVTGMGSRDGWIGKGKGELVRLEVRKNKIERGSGIVRSEIASKEKRLGRGRYGFVWSY